MLDIELVECISEPSKGSGTALGAQHRGLLDDDVVAGSGTSSWAWGWHQCGRRRHRLGSGKMAARKVAQPWSRTTTQRLQGGLDDGTCFGKVDDGAGSWKILGKKF
jgi:hypothetical protein